MAAMAAARRLCSGAERLGEAGSGNASEGGMGKLGHSVRRSRGVTWRQAMRQWCTAMVGVRSRAWMTRRPFTEHVACSEVGKVGAELS